MTERGTRSGRDFEDELRSYLGWLKPVLADVGLGWEDVAVAERDESTTEYAAVADGATEPAGRGREHAPAEFATRFSEIVESVPRVWINLTADTIRDGRLIVVIEWCSHPTPDDGKRFDRPVSVNWSGIGFAEIARLTGPPRR
jgi:hypothetical protein